MIADDSSSRRGSGADLVAIASLAASAASAAASAADAAALAASVLVTATAAKKESPQVIATIQITLVK